MKISNLTLENPFILAPLAGYTDLPFRILCKEYGASLCYSEMISCHGLVYQQKNTLKMIKSDPSERPVSFQLFGSEPEIMGEAAAILSSNPMDLLDINMGCPAKKVIKKGAGAALMKDMKLAAEIIDRVVENSKVPVTVKFRTGWNHQSITAVDFARMSQDHGASAIAVHGRTWSDGFGGTVNFEIIKRVKQQVSIPVIGNGDILSLESGKKMIRQTGCDAVMIGRAALGAPWIFSGNNSADKQQRLKAMLRHLDLLEQHMNPQLMMGRIKNHIGRYFKGLPGGSKIRCQVFDIKEFTHLKEMIKELLAEAG
jgi:tRNA-dihydrouridine synthase B